MAQILDYSAGYPGAAAIRAAGYQGVIRYLRKEGASRVKPLTVGELADMRAHELVVAVIYQHVDQWRTSQGRAAGRHDAEWVLAQARELGVRLRVIYIAVDHDTSPEQWPAIREYMLGAGEVLGLAVVGCYGEYDLLDYLAVRNAITWLWQTYAWSTGHNRDDQPRHPRAHLFQRLAKVVVGVIECDVNDVLKVDFGQIDIEEEPLSADDIDAWMDRPARHPATGAVVIDKFGNTVTNRAIWYYTNAGVWDSNEDLEDLARKVDELRDAGTDEDALAAALAPRVVAGLAEQGATGITPEQVAAALRGVLPEIRLTGSGA